MLAIRGISYLKKENEVDTGRGSLEMVSQDKVKAVMESGTPEEKAKLFQVGEKVTIRNSRFRIDNISTSHLSLKILPKE